MATFTISLIQYDMVNGVKVFATGSSWSIFLPVTNTNVIRKSTMLSSSTGSQSEPISTILGQEPAGAVIEGPLCEVDDVSTISTKVLSIKKHILNLFPVCSKVTVSGFDVTEVGGSYMVESFTIKRNLQRRSVIMYSLSLKRWYDD